MNNICSLYVEIFSVGVKLIDQRTHEIWKEVSNMYSSIVCHVRNIRQVRVSSTPVMLQNNYFLGFQFLKKIIIIIIIFSSQNAVMSKSHSLSLL